MVDAVGGLARMARSALFAVLTVALAAAAHELGGGVVGAGWAVGAGVAVMVVVNPVLGRRRPVLVQFPLMLVLQAGLHWVFMQADPSGCMHRTGHGAAPAGSPMSSPVGHVSHLLHTQAETGSGVARPACSSAAAAGLTTGTAWSMVLAHVAAAAVLVLLLSRGDAAASAVFSFLRLNRPALLLGPPPVLLAAAAVRPVGARVWVPPASLRTRAHRRRGPPPARWIRCVVTAR